MVMCSGLTLIYLKTLLKMCLLPITYMSKNYVVCLVYVMVCGKYPNPTSWMIFYHQYHCTMVVCGQFTTFQSMFWACNKYFNVTCTGLVTSTSILHQSRCTIKVNFNLFFFIPFHHFFHVICH